MFKCLQKKMAGLFFCTRSLTTSIFSATQDVLKTRF
jgi:hypothetical protein